MAESRIQKIDLGLTRNDFQGRPERAELLLETGKAPGGGVLSNAMVFWIGRSSRSHAFGAGKSGDFGERIVLERTARATQRSIDAQHERAFTTQRVAELTTEAKAHYPA